MKNIKSFEQYLEDNYEDVNEGLFSSDYKNAMKKWKAAFGYYYENGKGKVFMKNMIKGLKDKFKTNKKLLATIINTFDYVKKAKNGVGDNHNGVGGSGVKKIMPHIEDVAKNYSNDPHYYDSKAIEMIKKSGLELTDEDKKILDLNVSQSQKSQAQKAQGQAQKAQGQAQKAQGQAKTAQGQAKEVQGQVQESKIIKSFSDF